MTIAAPRGDCRDEHRTTSSTTSSTLRTCVHARRVRGAHLTHRSRVHHSAADHRSSTRRIALASSRRHRRRVHHHSVDSADHSAVHDGGTHDSSTHDLRAHDGATHDGPTHDHRDTHDHRPTDHDHRSHHYNLQEEEEALLSITMLLVNTSRSDPETRRSVDIQSEFVVAPSARSSQLPSCSRASP